MSTTKKYLKVKEYTKLSQGPVTEQYLTNPRYSTFKQVHYTAGDEEQFTQHITKENGQKLGKMDQKNKFFSFQPDISYLKFMTTNSVMDTFRYLFHELKKGIFVKILKNKLKVFLPFSKFNFTNKWGVNLKASKDFKNLWDLFRYCQTSSGRRFNPRRFNRNQNQWMGNNFLIRAEYPPREGDSNVACLKHMFETLCKSRDLPDMEFFVNRRDFPLMRKDGVHPYILASGEKTSIFPDNPCPILSMCSNDDYADIPIPTWDDWHRIGYQNYKLRFSTSYVNRSDREYPEVPIKEWRSKKDKAVFRGSSTGWGVTPETNKRLKLCKLALEDPRIDAGITDWNLRPRVIGSEKGEVIIGTIKSEELPFSLVEPLTPTEQAEYKYIIDVDGHACAFRLSQELGMGSVILLAKSPFKLWFKDLLSPGIHYIEVAEDLSDLSERLDWCFAHPEECEKIVENALKFYQNFLQEDGILDFLQNLLVQVNQKVAGYTYNVQNNWQPLLKIEKQLIKRKFKDASWFSTKLDGELLKSTKGTEIIRDGNLIQKIAKPNKIKEFEHEIFIGSVVLPTLSLKQFSVCKGRDKKSSVWGYLPGVVLSDFLRSDDFTFQIFEDVILQVCGILQVAWESLEFSHNDTYPWNIILLPGEGPIKYKTKRGTWKANGFKKVMLFDFGKSHVVFKNQHFGTIRPFESSSIRDIITFIVSTSNILLSRHCDKTSLTLIFKLMSFLSGNNPKYCRPMQAVKEVRKFTKFAKKYTEMMYSDKGALENLQPADLVKFLGNGEKWNGNFSNRMISFKLTENIFENPEELLSLVQMCLTRPVDPEIRTIKVVGTLITRANLRKYPNKQIYQEILQLLNKI